VLALIGVFSASLALLLLIINRLPVSSVASGVLRLPQNLDDAKELIYVLSELNERYYLEVMTLIFTSFVWLQMFALPGTFFFILASGMLFSFPVALGLMALASACGAISCYTISSLFCAPLVERYLSTKVENFRAQIRKLDGKFFVYMLFIRTTPFLPNWFVNVASPVIGVPAIPFFFGTLFGVIPPYILFLRVGRKIHDFATFEDAMPWEELAILWVAALVVALPVIFKARLARLLGISLPGIEANNQIKKTE